jgi:hypothetical protein
VLLQYYTAASSNSAFTMDASQNDELYPIAVLIDELKVGSIPLLHQLLLFFNLMPVAR